MPKDVATQAPYWERKALTEMNPQEWESLCDGCGRCCLHKLEDEDNGEIFYTRIACRLLEIGACRCRHYSQRQQHVPDCMVLTPDNLEQLNWMPDSCAYRRVADGRGLDWWHPLVSGDPNTVHTAGISVRGMAIAENQVDKADVEDYIVELSRD
ncbi:MAG: YcgN family cysteine cluster protein [Gammaproteobacteria bacterium]